MTAALGQLKTLQERYLAQGDTKLAAAIGADIRNLSARVDAVTAAINAKQFIVNALQQFAPWMVGGAAVPHQVPAVVSVRDVTMATQSRARVGPDRKII